MDNYADYQTHRNGPLKPELIAFLNAQRTENGWTYKQMGERLNITGGWTHKLLNHDGNINTGTYLARIAQGVDRLRAGNKDIQELREDASASPAERIHAYHLRDGVQVTFRLPSDLSDREAERLGLFIRSLAE